jgi:23S rRNA (uracil1939-C5)-methyltransferase
MARGLKPGPVQEADIVGLAHDGRGIARVDGKAVFVAGALPGERVTLRVIKQRRRMNEALLGEILVASPDRVVPLCSHYGVCGGCSLQHLRPQAQIAAKQSQLLEDLSRIGRVSPERVLPPLRGPAWGYRRRARLGVKFVHKKGRVLAGFREREKPYLAELQHCEVLPPALRSLPRELAALVETLSVRERLPQVELAVGDTATALVFRLLETPSAQDLQRLEAFGQRLGVQIYLQREGPESVRPLRADTAALRYRIAAFAVTIEFGPLDFVQVNAEINAGMVGAAIEALEVLPGERVLDLFCGLGNFTLPLARRAALVVGVEGDAHLVARARANAAANGANNTAFFAGNLFEPASFGDWSAGRYERVLLDPPRAGAREVVERMASWRPRRVVYISCHPGSLARDAAILVETQGYRLTAAGVMDMFPQTTHVESIAVFTRRE